MPINTDAATLSNWGFTPTPSSALDTNIHVVVPAQMFLSDTTRAKALTLGRDAGASAEAALVIGFAASQIIGTQLKSEINTICASCDVSGLASLWSTSASKKIS